VKNSFISLLKGKHHENLHSIIRKEFDMFSRITKDSPQIEWENEISDEEDTDEF